jgi:hypothetical protein
LHLLKKIGKGKEGEGGAGGEGEGKSVPKLL